MNTPLNQFREAVQVLKVVRNQNIDFDASVATPSQIRSEVVRLTATEDCYIEIGADPVATSASMIFLAGTEYIAVTPGHKIAALKITNAGKLSVGECE